MLIATCVATALLPVPVAGNQAANPSRQAAQSAQAAALRVVVLAGEDAVNVIQQRTAVAPLVEVRDRNNQPVAGAVVTFSIQGGQNAAFAAGANTLTVTTNAVGQAAVTSLTPTGSGVVQINVAASFQGQSAATAITQTNFATAAQAASSGSGASGSAGGASGGGGGLGAGAITGITAAAAGTVGGLFVYKKYAQGEPPNVESVNAFPDVGVQGATPISLSFSGSSHISGTVTYDFGDGTRITTAEGEFGPDHVYTQAGTFTASVTLTAHGQSSTGQTTVTIKSLTARWNLGATGSFFTLTQSGSNITGTFTAASGQGSGAVTGSVLAQRANVNTPNLQLSVTPSGPGLASTYTGSTFFNTADTIGGVFTSGTTTTTVQLTRQ